MNLQGRNLANGTQGTDVALLQKELAQLGFTIPPAETLRSTFGTATQQAVMQFQRTHALTTTGIVDPQTATAINQEVDKLQLQSVQLPSLPLQSLAPTPFIVRGQIRADGRPFAGATVQVVDKDLRSEQSLGSATTDTAGVYQVTYTPALFSRAEKDRADLIVRVVDSAGAVMAASPILFNAPADATVDIRVDPSIAGLPSEFERFVAELQPLLINVVVTGGPIPTPIDQLAVLTNDELDFLNGETGIERHKLAFLTAAATLQKKATTQRLNLPAAVFYGFVREGLPLDLPALGLISQQKQSYALNRAFDENIIPAALRTSLPTFLTQLQQLAVGEALQTPPASGTAAVGQLLGTVLAPTQQAAFLTAYANRGDQPIEDFWKTLRAQPQFARQVDSLQLTLQLSALAQNHLPLVQELQNTLKVTSPRDLIKLDVTAWTNLINKSTVGVPLGTPGTTPQEKTTNYVSGIINLLNAAFPTDSVAQTVATAPNIGLDVPTRQAVSQFFRNSPSFDLRSTRVDTYVAQNPAAFNGIPVADQPRVVSQLKRTQRLFQVSTSADTLTALLGTDLDSAHAIAQVPRSSFVARYQSTLGGEQQALALYQRAVAVNARSVHIYTVLNDALNGVRPHALSGNGTGATNALSLRMNALPNQPSQGGSPQNANGNAPSVADVIAKHIPNYAELFKDALDLCDCEHCRSVLSPAAYLVDLFEFLRNSTPNDKGNTPLDMLLARRPDLEQIPLTCENTETPLPYVDLVNEVLESYVALGHADASAAHDTGDATAQELNANPQNTNGKAYNLLAQAVFPFTVPFNQPVAASRVYLEHLGSSRYEVLNAFRKDDAPSTLRAISAEYLKISSEEYQVLIGKNVDGTNAPVREFYGYDMDDVTRTVGNVDVKKKWNDWLADVLELLHRTGIAYTDLVEILKTSFINTAYPQGDVLDFFVRIPISFADVANLVQTNFVNPAQEVLTALDQANISLQELKDWSSANFQRLARLIVLDAPGSKCDLSVTRLQHLDGTLLDDLELSKLHRFIRLWRKQGWSLADLDRALTALQVTDITPEVLSVISQIKQLQDQLSVSKLQILLSFWASIDTRGDDSLYKKLFLNKAALRIDPSFGPGQDGSVLSTPGLRLSDHIPTILAALRVSEADLSAIRTDAGLVDDPAAKPPVFAPLNLPDVSTLYRYAALAHALKLRTKDLIDLKTLAGIDPFATPGQTIQFAIAARKVQKSGFKMTQLNYIYRHLTAPPANLAPQPTTIQLLAKTLRDGLTKIVQENSLVPDPTGDTTRAKLALLFDSPVVDQAIAMITGRANYSAPLAVLPDPLAKKDLSNKNVLGIDAAKVPATVAHKMFYDPKAAMLRFQGAMTTAERTALLLASADGPYQAAVNNLFDQPGTFIKDTFTQNTLGGFLDVADAEKNLLRDTPSLDQDLKPVLLDQKGNPTTDSALSITTAIAEKFFYMLVRLLPYLRDQLSYTFIKQTTADALSLDSSLSQLLLESVLKSSGDPTQPAIADLLALVTGGVSASYFTSSDLTGAATVRQDAIIAFDGSATTPETTIPPGAGSARWSGMLLAPNNGDFTFSLRTGGSAQLWVGNSAQPVTLQLDPSTNELMSQAVPLRAGQLYELRLEVSQLSPQNAVAELRWQSATTPKAIIPSDNLYPLALLDNLTLTFTALHKAALIANTFKLTDKEVAYLSDANHAHSFDDFDLNELPLSRKESNSQQVDQDAVALFKWWLRLSDLVTLRNNLPGGEGGLIDVFAATSLDTAKSELARATGWDASAIGSLTASTGFNLSVSDFNNEIALLRLQEAMLLIKRLGVSAEQLFTWADAGVGFAKLEDVAHAIKKTVHAKYDEETWLTVAKPLSDVLRESQRDALVAYLLPRLGLSDSNQLFEQFLIDVDMSACMETSRIKQAISSIQLFVQRILMNLESNLDSSGKETGVAPSQIDADHWNQWEWMKRYRVWEANRKIFLFPENWIEPELRPDKSPFFKELESELLQNSLTTDTVETALMNYLDKLDQVARLEICGTYWQDKDPDTNEEVNVLHVFGRTSNTPHIYYYRRFLNNTSWTPWERLPLDIEGDHLLPVIWNRRLHLIWPMFAQQVEPPDTSQGVDISGNSIAPQEGKKYWQIRLAWSEYKQNKWQPRQITRDFLTSVHISSVSFNEKDFTMQPEKEGHVFEAAIDGEALVIKVYAKDALFEGMALLGEFRFESCGGVINIGYPLDIAPFPDEIPSHQARQSIVSESLSFPAAAGDFEFEMWREQDDPSSNQLQLWIYEEKKEKLFLAATPSRYRLLYPHQYQKYALQAPFFYQDDQRTYFVAPSAGVNSIAALVRPDQVPLDSRLFAPVSLPLAQGRISQAISNAGQLVGTTPGLSQLALAPPSPPGSRTLSSTSPISPAVSAQQTMTSNASSNWAIGASNNNLAWAGAAANASVIFTTHLQFFNYFHPYVCELEKSLNRDGISGLLNIGNQRLTDVKSLAVNIGISTNNFKQKYSPNTFNVDQPYPNEEVDFSDAGSYSLYNWELFFHAPMLIATRLSKNQRFADAMKWFHYILNPTDDALGEAAPARYWKVLPFKSTEQERLDDMLTRLNAGDNDLAKQIDTWRNHPFQPHMIARLRLSAYQTNVFMKYVDNLIAWGDQLFRQDTIESINEATQLYVMAADLLGSRPQQLPDRGKVAPKTYTDLKGNLDSFSNALVSLENEFPFSGGVAPDPGEGDSLLGVGRTLYFCTPRNDKLLGYWDTVADRLFKIRHCLNIEGVFRQLPLFEPPIDPALLVQAAAQGVDLSSVLNDLNAPLPYYRFSYMLQNALEMCTEVRSLGSALLSSLEKKDAEELALLRATHETNILNMIETAKSDQVSEAQTQLDALRQSQSNSTNDYIAYQMLLGVKAPGVPAWDQPITIVPIPTQFAPDGEDGLPLLQYEQDELDQSASARDWQGKASVIEITASSLAAQMPDIEVASKPFGTGVSVTAGLRNITAAFTANAQLCQHLAAQDTYKAGLAGKMGGHFRQLQQWRQQSNHAAGEFMQIGKQIAGANIRLAIAKQDLTVHQQQMQDAQKVQETLASKFTNQDLYSWMIGDISTTYFQCYQMAYDLAKKTERAFRFERGLTESNFIQFGYWDGLQKGLLAGDRLYLALKQMERAYHEQNKREYEITKHVSLMLNDPMALIALKETGHCELELPEALFDADYPGHYMRRIKSVSLTIPCVVGPYTSINCTLTLLKNKTRISSLAGSQYAEDVDNGDDRFVTNFAAMQSIATSHAQNDSGMFELNFRDERYLPFEGAGAVARWRIELPKDSNAFDLNTLSDVVLHLKYTARDGGDILKSNAKNALSQLLQDDDTAPLTRLFSLKHEFPTDWYRFLHPNDPSPGADIVHGMTIDLGRERFPFQFRGKTLTIISLRLFLKVKESFAYDDQTNALMVHLNNDTGSQFVVAGSPVNGLPVTSPTGPTDVPTQFTLEAQEAELPKTPASQTSWWESVNINGANHTRLKADAVEDIWVTCDYSVTGS